MNTILAVSTVGHPPHFGVTMRRATARVKRFGRHPFLLTHRFALEQAQNVGAMMMRHKVATASAALGAGVLGWGLATPIPPTAEDIDTFQRFAAADIASLAKGAKLTLGGALMGWPVVKKICAVGLNALVRQLHPHASGS